MIDFRYFLVTISSIFLALAVGVVLGAGPLKGGLDAQLRASIEEFGTEKAELRDEIEQRERMDNYRDAFATEVAPALVEERLAGHEVVLVALPEADSGMVNAVRDSVTVAGGAVTGTVQVTEKWADPTQRQFLKDVAAQLAVDGVRLPEHGSPYDRAGAVLARAVVTSGTPPAGSEIATTTIMGGFGEGDLLTTDTDDLVPADLAVVIAPSVESPAEAVPDADQVDLVNKAWVALCRTLDNASKGCVLAGDPSAAGEAGVLNTLRSDGRTSRMVSSVDVADVPSGQIALVWALAEQAEGGVGHYGLVGTTDGALPRLSDDP